MAGRGLTWALWDSPTGLRVSRTAADTTGLERTVWKCSRTASGATTVALRREASSANGSRVRLAFNPLVEPVGLEPRRYTEPYSPGHLFFPFADYSTGHTTTASPIPREFLLLLLPSLQNIAVSKSVQNIKSSGLNVYITLLNIPVCLCHPAWCTASQERLMLIC